MAQKHNEQYVNAPMTRLGTIGWPDQDRRVIRSSAFVASKWTAENPILQLGEVGYETDTNKLKVGDGVTKWNSLPYAGDGAGSSLPDQTGHAGEFLTTDGTDASWAAVESLPSQTGHSGEFLTTDGTDASWGAVSEVPSTTGATEGDVLTVDSNGDPAWTTPSGGGLPDQTGQSGKFLTTDGTDASWGTINALQNTATGTDSLTIGGTAATANYATNVGAGSSSGISGVAVGRNASASGNSVAVGNGCTAGSTAVVVGRGANGGSSTYVTLIGPYAATTSTVTGGVAIGSQAKIGAGNAIQINATTSAVTNSDSNTFKVANANGNFELMNANGNLPADRLASTTGLADGNYRLRLVMASGVPTLEWVAE